MNLSGSYLKKEYLIYFLTLCGVCSCTTTLKDTGEKSKRPNVLFIISDDQGYPYTTAYGSQMVHTPVFDKIAQEGILFTNAFVCAPQCSPSRASILTGQQVWQNGPAGTHWSTFSAGLTTYTDILKRNGYEIGYTGKGWAPGNWIDGGRKFNPAGVKYIDTKDADAYTKSRTANGISKEDYAGSFELFLDKIEKGKPFCFWMGGWEPHRPYERGSGLKLGKKLSSVKVPPYLPQSDTIKSDFLDYALEIEWFDTQAGNALKKLKERGLLDNTLIVFTSDNGMPFPRAKAFSFDDGNHVPLAIMWKGHIIKPGRIVEDLVSALDFFPTFLEAAGLKNNVGDRQGKSLFNIFNNGKSGITDTDRKYIYWGRERHGSARWDNLGYPQRAVRSDHYLYIWNLRPERYPAGAPKEYNGDTLVWDYGDIDPSPSKDFMIHHQGKLFDMAFDKFPKEMLYDIKKDPYCMHNLADDPNFKDIKKKLSDVLMRELKKTGDPRIGNYPDIWESYRRYGPIHRFPRPTWADSIIKNQAVRN